MKFFSIQNCQSQTHPSAQALRLLALVVLLLSLGISTARAEKYVFIYNGNYLGINASGQITNYTTFDAAHCVWTCYKGANEATLGTDNNNLCSLKNGIYYLNGKTDGNAIGSSTNEKQFWRRDNSNRLIYRNSNDYYLYYRGSYWRTSNTQDTKNSSSDNNYSGRNTNPDYRAIAYVGTNHPATGGIAITANPATIENVNGTSDLRTTFNAYTQPYVTFNIGGVVHNVYGNADHGNTTPTTLHDLNGSTYSWTMENAGSNAVLHANPNIWWTNVTYSTFSATDRVVTVKLTVSNAAYNFNQEATTTVTLARAVTNITSLSQITNQNGSYKLVADVNASGSTMIENFNGYFDGDFHVITGLTHPIFNTLNGAEVKNVIVDHVNISRNGDAGAIACQAYGNSRIYNCGVLSTGSTFEFDKSVSGNTSTIKTTGNGVSVGGIVGAIFDNTRVANCFSYADVSATGGNNPHASGIVGWANNWVNSNNYVTNGTNCFVVNCMFYGNLTGGLRSPIVYVNGFNNTYTTWSYFRYKSIPNVTGLNQNGALAAQEDMWLKRFKFFQSAVTNHRDMAAVYIFNDASRINEIAQWYIDESIAPWPILRNAGPQKSVLERTIPNTGNANEGNLITNGKRLLSSEDGTTVLDADVTQRYNMNVGSNGMLHVNFDISGTGVASGGHTYSVDLPITDMDFAHYDYTWGKVVLPFANEFEGWTPNYEYICTGWEITSVTGGTAGTLTDYNFADRNCTAKDIYHATNNPIIFAQGGNWIVPYGVTSINVKAHFAKAYYLSDPNYDCSGNGGNAIGGTRPTTYHGRPVYTTVQNAWGAMENKTLPHDQALVLVGNYHYNSNQSGNYTNKGCTIMSIDEDKDQQPDYGWYASVNSYRAEWMPMRWDFIALYGFNMVQTNTAPPGIAIPIAKGWLEFTETTICRTYEFESNDGSRTNNDDNHSRNAWIINGCYFQQMVRTYNGDANKLSYMKVGGSAYIKEFFCGNHSGTNHKFTLRPIIVTGGEIAQCFLTGMGNKNEITATDNNVRFYCAGGKIDKYLSVYNGYPVVDATMKVDHARIGRFFGGGTSPKAQLSGNINVTMDNSYVDFFCGGPEFGDMGNGKTVTVSTTGSIFGEYYGAGFGGTALTRITNGDGQKGPFNTNNGTRARLSYNADEGGFEVSYEMEAILDGGGNSLYRYYDYRADLSMATVGPTTTTAKKCLFLSNFYGGGCQGKVNGTINSSLTNCDVVENAFGGGYKAAATTIDVYPTGGNTWQVWDGTYKAYSDPVYPTPEVFTWQHGNNNTSDDSRNILYTKADMTQMGRVTGAISITVNGGAVGKNVYGGGNESPSDDAATVLIKGGAHVGQDVFGGGNIASVGKSVTVTLGDGEIADASNVAGSIYGGGALANTNTTSGNTTVNLFGGSVTDVYGGALGNASTAAYVYGPITVNLGNNGTNSTMSSIVNGSIFGCNNVNGTPKSSAEVHIYRTTHRAGQASDEYDVPNVYGGGNQADYTPDNANNHSTLVHVYGCDNSIQNLYGGGNAACTPANHLIVEGGTFDYVFGGGNGAGVGNPGANVGYHHYADNDPAPHTSAQYGTGVATTEIKGGKIHNLFGGSNTKGNIRQTALSTIAEDEGSTCNLVIDEVYGGGNEAYMDGDIVLDLHCNQGFKALYGGAKAANINKDINLTITSGDFGRIFGGNNMSGTINGSITVNIEETGCYPIRIGELYGGGNQAAYSTPAGKRGPTINIISCTEIGKVFGGGYGEDATVTGDTYVNINMIKGAATKGGSSTSVGTIGEVYGGGYGAPLEGNTHVNIGTKSQVTLQSLTTDKVKTVEGVHIGDVEMHLYGETFTGTGTIFGGGFGEDAILTGDTHVDIRGNNTRIDHNVYGGGNGAKVTGNTDIIIGEDPE